MAEYSYFWDGVVTGDAVQAPYSSTEFSQFMRVLLNSDRTLQGPVHGIDDELLVSGASSPLTVKKGWGVVLGRLYQLSADTTLALSAVAAGHVRVDLVCLRADTAAQTIRAYVHENPSLDVAAPAPTQTAAYWEVPLADATIDEFGNVTLIDRRQFVVSPLGPIVHDVRQAADDPTMTADAWNDLNGTTSLTIQPGKYLIWGTCYWENANSESGMRQLRVYDQSSGATVCIGSGWSDAQVEGNTIATMPRLYTVTGQTELRLQFYALNTGDTVYGGTSGASTDDNCTGMVAIQVA